MVAESISSKSYLDGDGAISSKSDFDGDGAISSKSDLDGDGAISSKSDLDCGPKRWFRYRLSEPLSSS